jgi:two-component system, NarL family, nitrate/nitrite response regulator NarL
MKILFFSSDIGAIDEWKKRHAIKGSTTAYDAESLDKILSALKEPHIVMADYDSVAHDINKLITSNKLPENTIVLEKTPEISSGKMLVSHGVKAYANARISNAHYLQMINAVANAKVWTYPELTAALAKGSSAPTINDDAKELIQNRLSPKEIEVVYSILDGLTNDAIASQLDITTRTVKAHISSIFSKLRVNDRLSLVLLLK